METNKSYVILAAVSLLLGVAHNFLFFDKGIGINIVIFTILIIAVGILLLRQFHKALNRQCAALFLLPAVIFACMVILRASELLVFFNIVAITLLFFMFVGVSTGKSIHSYLLFDYLKLVFLPLRFIRPFFAVCWKIFCFKYIQELSPTSREILRGSILAVLAVVVFGVLFASADDVFRSLLPDLNLFSTNEEFLIRSILAVFMTSVFIGAFGYLFSSPNIIQSSTVSPLKWKFGAIEATILFGAINALFLLFITLQFAYLFGGEGRVTALGLTYAEYARKGFFELILVAILSFLIIFTAEQRVIKKGDSHSQLFKILSVALVAQVVLILVSASTRLSLYENAYGFTNVRIYSHALMIWMGLVLALLAYHILSNGRREAFMYRVLLLAILFLFGMNILNPEAFIARHNIERFKSTGKLDTTYLAHLSDDALPETLILLDDQSEEVRNSFARELYGARNSENRDNMDWESFRLSRMEAQSLISPKRSQLEASSDIFTPN